MSACNFSYQGCTPKSGRVVPGGGDRPTQRSALCSQGQERRSELVRTKPTKRDEDFLKSLPAFDWQLGGVDPFLYLDGSHDPAVAEAAQWAYHIDHALGIARFALLMAYTNQHPGFRGKTSKLFGKICWFELSVLSHQSSWDKQAQLIRCRRRLEQWHYLDKEGRLKSRRVGDPNTNLWTVAQHFEAVGQQTPAERQLLAFARDRDTQIVRRIANRLKHGETLAWKGFAVVPVVEVEYSAEPMPLSGATPPKRADVGWICSIQQAGDPADRAQIATRMHYGHRRQLDIQLVVNRVAHVYRSLVPAADAVTREYLGIPVLDSAPPAQ